MDEVIIRKASIEDALVGFDKKLNDVTHMFQVCLEWFCVFLDGILIDTDHHVPSETASKSNILAKRDDLEHLVAYNLKSPRQFQLISHCDGADTKDDIAPVIKDS